METLLAFLHQVHPLSPALVSRLQEVVVFKALKRKTFLLKAGQVSREICFIEQGLLRCFFKRKGLDISVWFMKEHDVVVSVPSFYQQVVSYEYIQALTNCELYCLSYNELQAIYRDFPEFNYVGRVLTEKYYTLSEERLYPLRIMDAHERFKYMQEHYPDLFQRFSGRHISTYFGMREETLSRLRGRM